MNPSPTSMEPRIRGYNHYENGIADVVQMLTTGSRRVQFFYDHYSAFDITATWHTAGCYVLTIGYTNMARVTRVWFALGTNPDAMARQFGLNAGHDVETLGKLLRDLGHALAEEAL